VILSFELIEPSQRINEIASFGINTSQLCHFRIQGSHGSVLEIIASDISISESVTK